MQIGGASLSNVPEWVPIYPNAGEASNVMNRRKNGKSIGALTFATQDETDAIAEHYRTTLSEAGFTINQESSSFNGNQQVVLTADHPDEGKTLGIIAGGMGAQQTLVINYEEK